jgi:hypothetical protein
MAYGWSRASTITTTTGAGATTGATSGATTTGATATTGATTGAATIATSHWPNNTEQQQNVSVPKM